MSSFWDKDITYLKRVGPQRAKVLFSECGIRTYGDLLTYFPRKYVDRSQVVKVVEVQGTEAHVTLVGKLTHVQKVKGHKGRGRLTATFTDGSGFMELTWFQGIKWLEQKLKTGEEIALFGRPSRYNGMLSMSHPEIDYLNQENGARKTGGIIPFYPSTEKLSRVGLDARGLRQLMHQLLEEGRYHMAENLSTHVRQENQLISRPQALLHIHFPPDFVALEQATRRLKFEEFFFFQLMLARRRSHKRLANVSAPFPAIGKYFNDYFHNQIPFELTGAQKRVLKEIRRDVSQPVQMNRLVQGDVGSGKTMVGFMTMLMALDNGFQAALMAPTAILAEQHYKKITAYATPLGLTTGIILGGQRKAERREVLEGLLDGTIDIVVGTHALIEETVQFQKLGLVIVDEQHKFGVMQRARLWQKAEPFPHNLIMTATPIPRTLAMTLYGDVDVSVIDELPPGRKPIETWVHGESKRLQVLGFIKRQIEQGRQAYVVYPLIEESEKMDLVAAVQGFELLEKYFKDYRVSIVHGKMKADDKEMEMQRFVKNQTQILVSTTVIEVGVDVPNASVMVIENAERFGLSQLHQLRGRVGRGGEQSYCILMAGPKVSKEGRQRLKAMKETNDGFKIAEFDLQLRGPGDFLGTRQSGLPEFQLASLGEDQEILREAREAAFSLNEADPTLTMPENVPIRAYYKEYGRKYAVVGTVA